MSTSGPVAEGRDTENETCGRWGFGKANYTQISK